jgi:hypothetical protein
MTEVEWLACSDPTEMLRQLPRGELPERKLRLFACACCRGVWESLKDSRCRNAVETAEQHADGIVRDRELEAVAEGALEAFAEAGGLADKCGFAEASSLSATNGARAAYCAARPRPADERQMADIMYEFTMLPACASFMGTEEDSDRHRGAFDRHQKGTSSTQCQLLRCIIGNPFRPPRVEQTWLRWNDGMIVSIAQVIYDERAFERLPILADALEDAGCGDEQILAHSRGPGPHATGCFVLDALLGKQ